MKNCKMMLVLAGTAVGMSGLTALAGEPVSRDEVRAIVAEMLADAETRSSLLAGGGDAGYDKNFFMASADGNYRLNISGYVQTRYTMNFASDTRYPFGPVPGADDFNNGFSIRQAKIAFSGNIVNPDLTFRIEGLFGAGDGVWGSSTSGNGQFNLEDCWFNYRIGNGWSVRGGQYKSYFMREDLNADTYTMAAERGMVNLAFAQGRVQGFGARYQAENWWIGADITDGFRSQNSDFTSSREADLAITGRFEYRFSGTEEQLKDYTSMPGDPWGAYIGGALHYQLANNDPFFSVVDNNYLSYTIDGQIEGGGWSLFAAFVGSHTDVNFPTGGPADTNFDDFGLTVQGAWRFMQNDEIFLRYDGLLMDSNRGMSPDAFNFLTFGYNHYFAGHAAKLTVDCVLALNHTGPLIGPTAAVVPSGNPLPGGQQGPLLPNNGVGLLGSFDGMDAAVRVQFQFMF